MRQAAATLVMALLVWTEQGVADPGAAVTVPFGQQFSLRPGQSVRTGDGTLRVGFEGVLADSRCPKGEQCIRAGDATVRLWLQPGLGPKETADLRAAAGGAQTARVAGHELRLLRLDPDPVTGKPIARADYVVTLTMNLDSTAAPER